MSNAFLFAANANVARAVVRVFLRATVNLGRTGYIRPPTTGPMGVMAALRTCCLITAEGGG